jgi:hypothetical protein
MEIKTNGRNTMTDRIESIYTDLKFADRMTPGRTPWQTLRKRAAELAAAEAEGVSRGVAARASYDATLYRLPLMDANSDNPLEASIARLRKEA